jgi:5-methylcytosine-specific restriction endonuclease McrA
MESIEHIMRRKTHCFYCSVRLINTKSLKPNANRLTKDHIIPSSYGGKSKKINFVYCCKKCNKRKSNYSIFYYKEYLTRNYNEYHRVKLLCSYVRENFQKLFNV